MPRWKKHKPVLANAICLKLSNKSLNLEGSRPRAAPRIKNEQSNICNCVSHTAFVFFPRVSCSSPHPVIFGMGEGDAGWAVYLDILRKPRYLNTLILTVLVSLATTFAALAVSTTAGMFLVRNRFRGRGSLLAVLTLPLAFPGVVIGFLIILLGGRQGLINQITPGHVVFAYSALGLFLGYLYFSIPRVLLTVMAAAEKLDPALEEAARTMGATPYSVMKDVIIPGLMPSLIASGAIAFATAMGAFGTAFTLATNIDVIPMVIYTEFTLSANIAMASALSIVLGIITWILLLIARSLTGSTVAGGG